MIVRGGLVKKWKQVFHGDLFSLMETMHSRCSGRLTMSAALPPVGELGRQQLSLSLICRLEITTDN